MDQLRRELADKLNLQSFDDCNSRKEKDSWYASLGRVNTIMDELEKRELLKDEANK